MQEILGEVAYSILYNFYHTAVCLVLFSQHRLICPSEANLRSVKIFALTHYRISR